MRVWNVPRIAPSRPPSTTRVCAARRGEERGFLSGEIVVKSTIVGLTSVTTRLSSLPDPRRAYESLFLVDMGATDSMAPSDELERAGIKPEGKMTYELADGTLREYPFGLVRIEFMGETTAGRVIFGPRGSEPLLGVTALESVGITVDPASRTLKRLPAVPLK
jgi:clan AA aspartic protease